LLGLVLADFYIKTPGNKEILIDPWIKKNPSYPETIKNIEKVDCILFTHAHRKSHNHSRIAKIGMCKVNDRRDRVAHHL
jgi:L-ascorbate metabolism protein UlaG (beta-lactamase superfamily)